MEKIKLGLNARQFKLYNYLKSRKGYVNLKTILNDLINEYNYFDSYTEFNNKGSRRTLTSDLETLQRSDIHKVIIRCNKGIKIAENLEDLQQLEKRRISLLKQLETVNKQIKKSKMHNQTRLTFNKETKIIASFKE